MASAAGPEKAAADLLPLDATFDPETHEGAGELTMICCTVLRPATNPTCMPCCAQAYCHVVKCLCYALPCQCCLMCYVIA